jgi:hypothetical protein
MHRRRHLRQEPDAGIPLVRIRGGGCVQRFVARRALDDFVFQRRDSERSLPPVGLRDKHPRHRLRSIRSSLQPFGKVLEIPPQKLLVFRRPGLGRFGIPAWRLST